ncbi:PucR family transcriptional regulator [Paenibacillus radicis (ex Gao et al. 2016)]|uniref:Purine catabolism regulatory protein n=1 Tax=Paenibacillus radicis (ex Gao et al. 2016) TaxID=1737354 RepID=A0A917M0B2_9BACL|nr:PucR family transcriptional regulator [Paenibacillus radicis (ex Gao et al. 2016)]GGG69029.1 purine catabolism regulatory protein [Paenibacillus radicis (ex Gao et al. 2016)]
MHITVEDALTVYPLSEGSLVAGSEGVYRTISSINLMDAPDVINWMKEGELLLTTAYAIRDSPEEFVILLQKLSERGASGLGIKLGRYWKEIPQAVLLEADRLQLPLIELPFAFTFSEQITALFQSEFQRDTRKLNERLEMQKKLVDFAMQADEYTNYFQSIHRILAHPIAVFTSEGVILYNVTICSETELLCEWPWQTDNRFYKAAHNQFYRIPLLKNGKTYGHLLVQTEQLQDEIEGIFHQAAVILAYHLEVIQNQEEAAAGRRLGTAMERYLKGIVSQQTVLEFAEALGSGFWNTPFVCMMSAAETSAWDPNMQRRRLREIQDRLQEHPKTATLVSHHFYVLNRLYSLLQIPEDVAKDRKLYEHSIRLYGEIINGWSHGTESCTSFSSKIRAGIDALIDGFQECMDAERISTELGISESVVLFADLEFVHLFRHIPQEVMRRFCTYLFQPLLDKDEEYTDEMMRTLEAYFANNGQVNETARALYIHRNTVLYRLEKITGLMNLDLKNNDHLLMLKLGLMFRDMMISDK